MKNPTVGAVATILATSVLLGLGHHEVSHAHYTAALLGYLCGLAVLVLGLVYSLAESRPLELFRCLKCHSTDDQVELALSGLCRDCADEPGHFRGDSAQQLRDEFIHLHPAKCTCGAETLASVSAGVGLRTTVRHHSYCAKRRHAC